MIGRSGPNPPEHDAAKGGSPVLIEELGRIDLPHGRSGDYDHADVHAPTGRVFVANTELAQVEVDGSS